MVKAEAKGRFGQLGSSGEVEGKGERWVDLEVQLRGRGREGPSPGKGRCRKEQVWWERCRERPDPTFLCPRSNATTSTRL